MPTEEIEPIDCAGKIDPSLFPVPETLTHILESHARKLRTGGVNMSQTGDDIVSAWDGLSECYSAPEAEELYSALAPVTSNGAVIELATERVASALETFAETVREIQADWRTLKNDVNAFRIEIADEGEDWDKGDGPLGWGDSSNVARNKELLLRAANLVEDFKEAEVACADKINIGIAGRTDFVSEDDLDGAMPQANQFVHGVGVDLEEIPTAWGEAAAETDHGWVRDVGDAVWDFGVGAAEDVGAMVGAHSSQGWFNQSWGDALKEYHWDNLTSAASLVGMYDAESDSLGWSGLGSAGEAWKDLAHSVVPWEEWGERPGYVIGTALLNIGATVGGAALTATGVGAVVGVPLMLWRGAAVLDGMGSSGRGGSGMDVDLPELPEMPAYGGSGAPVVNIDTSSFTPAQKAEMTASLDRLNATVNGGGGSSSSGESSAAGRPSHARLTHNGQEADPRAGDLDRAERVASLESSNRDNDASEGAKKSDAKKAPTWTGDPKDSVEPNPKKNGSEEEPAYAGGRGDDDTFAESKKTPTGTPTQANATKIDAPGTGTRSGNETPEQQTGDRSVDLQDDKNTVQNQADKGPGPHNDGPGDNEGSFNEKKPGPEFTEKENTHSVISDLPSDRGTTNASGGNPPTEGPSSPSEPDKITGPDLEKRLAKATKLEDRLKAGMSDEEIARLRGEHSRDGDQWQRLATTVNAEMIGGSKIDKILNPKAIKFALDGASNPREFAYRYEYYKAAFTEASQGVMERESLTKNQARPGAKQMMLELETRLESRISYDRDVVRSARGEDFVKIDTSLPTRELVDAIREESGRIGMGDANSAAYHARKHYKELPEVEKSLTAAERDISSDFSPKVVQDYLDSMEQTIREGHISGDPVISDDGSQRIVFERSIDRDGNPIINEEGEPGSVKARLLVTADGRVLVPTFGKM